MAVAGVELFVGNFDARSLQCGQPAFEEPIHDLLI